MQGRKRPYRPCPSDFRETYLDMGWEGIEQHYRTNWRCIARWIDECGGESLCRERRALVLARGPRILHRGDH